MAYVLVPEGFKLQKVTKAQKVAIDEHNRAQILKRFAGSTNSSVIFIIAAAVGLYFLAKQIKMPGFDVIGSFAQVFPQLSAALGIKGELTAEQAATIQKWMTEGAGPDAKPFLQLMFPTPEERAEMQQVDIGRFGI